MFELSGVPSFIVALPSGSGIGPVVSAAARGVPARRDELQPCGPHRDTCLTRRWPGSPLPSFGTLPFTRDPPREAGHDGPALRAARKQQPIEQHDLWLCHSDQSLPSVPGVDPAHPAGPAVTGSDDVAEA